MPLLEMLEKGEETEHQIIMEMMDAQTESRSRPNVSSHCSRVLLMFGIGQNWPLSPIGTEMWLVLYQVCEPVMGGQVQSIILET